MGRFHWSSSLNFCIHRVSTSPLVHQLPIQPLQVHNRRPTSRSLSGRVSRTFSRLVSPYRRAIFLLLARYCRHPRSFGIRLYCYTRLDHQRDTIGCTHVHKYILRCVWVDVCVSLNLLYAILGLIVSPVYPLTFLRPLYQQHIDGATRPYSCHPHKVHVLIECR